MLSNLGMFGVEHFDAIPVPGASAILAVGAVTGEGMMLTLSCDHRVINGADAARYLADLKALIESPESWLGGGLSLIPEGEYDVQVAVIGGGTGGEDAARELAENGVSVALINDAPLPGGECLWRGCIPSKAWRAAANRMRDRAGDGLLGVSGTDKPKLDWSALEAHRKDVLQTRGEMAYKADKGLKIDYRQGRARLTGEHSLAYTDPDGAEHELTFGAAILATGAPPLVPPIPGADRKGVETSSTIWSLESPPKRLAVVGAGAIGLEMAQIFRDFGAKVTVFEVADRVLPEVEGEVAKTLTQALGHEESLTLHLGAKVDKIEGQPGNLTVQFTDAEGKGRQATVDRVLMATGKRPELSGLGLEAAGVETDGAFIRVSEHCRTSVAHIYAVGDVIPGRPDAGPHGGHPGAGGGGQPARRARPLRPGPGLRRDLHPPRGRLRRPHRGAGQGRRLRSGGGQDPGQDRRHGHDRGRGARPDQDGGGQGHPPHPGRAHPGRPRRQPDRRGSDNGLRAPDGGAGGRGHPPPSHPDRDVRGPGPAPAEPAQARRQEGGQGLTLPVLPQKPPRFW